MSQNQKDTAIVILLQCLLFFSAVLALVCGVLAVASQNTPLWEKIIVAALSLGTFFAAAKLIR